MPAAESSCTALEALVGDWYWEQDADNRFTVVQRRGCAPVREDQELIGRRCWELDREVVSPGGWPAVREALRAHQPFRDVVLQQRLPDGSATYVSISGVPRFDPAGTFVGYRGIGRDVTAQRQREDDLERFRAAIDASLDMIYLTDPESLRFLYVNEAACRISGYSVEEHLKISPTRLLMTSPDELRESYRKVIEAGEEGLVVELPARGKDGRRTVTEVRRRAITLDGRPLIVTISRDVSQRIRQERAIRRLSRMFAALSSTNEAILRVRSAPELYQRVCDAAVHGGQFLSAAVLLPDGDADRLGVVAASGPLAETLARAEMSARADRAEGQGLAGTAYRNRAPCVTNDFLKDPRTARWHETAAAVGIRAAAALPLLRGDEILGLLMFYSGDKRSFDDEVLTLLERMAENIVFALDRFALEAERRLAEERAQYLATHDALTGLPNRVMFSQVLSLAIAAAGREQHAFALLFIDLDRFKIINDTLGHEAGDVLLKEMSERFRRCVRAGDVVARLGGDEFVILLHGIEGQHDVAAVARKILGQATRPIAVLGHDCRVSASIGISLFPRDADDEQSLMKNADIAMYLAKGDGKNTFQFYSSEIRAQSLERLTIETELRRALENDELSLHYQAKLDLETGGIAGVEALLRWDSAEIGSVAPARFLPVAEDSGLIVPIGRWVLRTACAQSAAWQRAGLPPLPIAVNLSPRQFQDPDLVAQVTTTLSESGLMPELLELEVTEGMVMQDTERAVAVLSELKALGVRIAIDDFGTGYAKLCQLERFPIDTLKVDRSFIRELPRDGDDRRITEAIIALGRSLCLTIVAEGVENAQQHAYLREHACDQIQGFYFSKPLEADAFAELVRGHTVSG